MYFPPVDVVLRTNRLRWFSHVECGTGWFAHLRKMEVPSEKRSGRLNETWEEVVQQVPARLGMDSTDTQSCRV